MFQFLSNQKHQYAPVNGSSQLRSHYNFRFVFLIATLLLVTTITGFYAGRHSRSNSPSGIINCNTRPISNTAQLQVALMRNRKYQRATKSSATILCSAPLPQMHLMPRGLQSSLNRAVFSSIPSSPRNVLHWRSSTNCTVLFVQLLPSPFLHPFPITNHHPSTLPYPRIR